MGQTPCLTTKATLLRWGGIIYLLWLAWDGWREAGETSPGKVDAAPDDARYFLRGLITNLLNPKAALFYVAVLPGFVVGTGAVLPQTLLLSVVYVAVATAIHTGIVAAAGTARQFLQDDVRRRRVGRALSLLLAGIAIWFGWSTAR